MSGSTTPNYSFALPTIGGDQNSWGNELNSNWTKLDALLHANASQSTGDVTIGGNLYVNGSTTPAFGVFNGNPTLALDPSHTFWVGPAGDFNWTYGSSVIMNLDPGGIDLLSGQAYKPGGGPWASISDERTKRDMTPYLAGLDHICRLQPIAFRYNGEGGTADDGKTYYGLSAQATQTAMPELVHEMPATGATLPGQLATQLGPLLLAVVNAVRELAGRVAALEGNRA